MSFGSRPILYALAFLILAAVFGWIIWHYIAAIIFAFIGWNTLRALLYRAGLRRPRARRGSRVSSVTQIVEAVSQATIAWNMRGIKPAKREAIPAGPTPIYRKPRGQVANDSPEWDDPEWPFRGA